MRSLGWPLVKYDWSTYEKRKSGHTNMHTRRTPSHREGSNQSKSFISQAITKTVSKAPEARTMKRMLTRSSSQNQPC